MVAFVGSLLVLILVASLMVPMATRRPVGTPLTWGEAMVASVWAYLLMFWAYGVVPHLWLTWADNELGWRPDRILYGPGDIVKPQSMEGWFPVTITYQTIRDLIAVTIYVIFLVAQVWMWIWWQNRAKRAEAAASAKASVTSGYGRPLVRRG